MSTHKILIASSQRTTILAEKLRDQLKTNFSHADLWNDVIRGRPAETTIEMLERASEKYDFSVIIFDDSEADTDRQPKQHGEQDNRSFEAGFFTAALGREHCFIINSNKRPYMPSDLGGIAPLFFEEPETFRLDDREAWGAAIRGVSSQILDRIQLLDYEKKEKDRPLSKETLLDRERRLNKGGELEESDIVVAVTVPLEIEYKVAKQVRSNIEDGIGYVYYFHGDSNRVTRICQLLQMVLLSPMLENTEDAEFRKRIIKLKTPEIQNRIIEDLEFICDSQLLKIYLLPTPPMLQYVIHNATSSNTLILYLKHGDTFIEWERGEQAYQIWQGIKKQIWSEDKPNDAIKSSASPEGIFCCTPGFDYRENRFYSSLRYEIRRLFPGFDDKILELCCRI